MKIDTPEPLLNARFRIEIDGLRTATAIEVIFPDARIVGDGETPRAVQYGTLTLRRGMTASGDWYRWWDSARGSTDRSGQARRDRADGPRQRRRQPVDLHKRGTCRLPRVAAERASK